MPFTSSSLLFPDHYHRAWVTTSILSVPLNDRFALRAPTQLSHIDISYTWYSICLFGSLEISSSRTSSKFYSQLPRPRLENFNILLPLHFIPNDTGVFLRRGVIYLRQDKSIEDLFVKTLFSYLYKSIIYMQIYHLNKIISP